MYKVHKPSDSVSMYNLHYAYSHNWFHLLLSFNRIQFGFLNPSTIDRATGVLNFTLEFTSKQYYLHLNHPVEVTAHYSVITRNKNLLLLTITANYNVTMQRKLAQAVGFLTCIWEEHGPNPGLHIDYPEVRHRFPHFLIISSVTTIEITPWPLPSTCLQTQQPP
jgi:hypothetical protein